MTQIQRKPADRVLFVLLSLLMAISVLVCALPLHAAGLTKVTSCKGITVCGSGSNWYTYKGGVRVSYTGVAQNQYGWWYCENGKVNFGKTSIEPNDYGWWYCRNGKVDFGKTSVEKNDYGWWCVQKGKVNFSFTGLAKNQYGWWYCKNGKVNFSFTGLAKNNYGLWYCRNGKVDFSVKNGDKVKWGSWSQMLQSLKTYAAQKGYVWVDSWTSLPASGSTYDMIQPIGSWADVYSPNDLKTEAYEVLDYCAEQSRKNTGTPSVGAAIYDRPNTLGKSSADQKELETHFFSQADGYQDNPYVYQDDGSEWLITAFYAK